jgi:hypothetical protein
MMGTNGENLTFTPETDVPQDDTRIACCIDGTFDAPLFLTNDGRPRSRRSSRDDADAAGAGHVSRAVHRDRPACAIDSPTPVPLIIYATACSAHRTRSSSARATPRQAFSVIVGTDMRGMSEVDVANVALALNDANNGHAIFDVLVQGMINHVALVQIARGPMATTLFAKQGGGSLVDPNKFHYYGISQGGIMGTTVCAIDPVIEKCVLQVGAINYSLLLERCRLADLSHHADRRVPDPLDAALVINLMQSQWDRTEPTGVADVIPGEGFRARRRSRCSQIAIADDEVSNLASEYQVRTMGIPAPTLSSYVPFGVMSSDAGPGWPRDLRLRPRRHDPADQRAAARQHGALQYPQQAGDDRHDEGVLRDRPHRPEVHRAERLRLHRRERLRRRALAGRLRLRRLGSLAHDDEVVAELDVGIAEPELQRALRLRLELARPYR